MLKNVLIAGTALALVVLISACGPSKTVQRIGTDTTVDLSGEWNDTDSRLVAQEMIKDVTNRPWLSEFQSKIGRKPTVVVGKVVNRSQDHIEVKTFIKNLERELINAGTVDFVAGTGEREQLREERMEQAREASVETQKASGQETGADFMLIGTLTSIVDKEGGQAVKYYQVNLELVNIESNKKVWIGEKQIKKFISQDRVKL